MTPVPNQLRLLSNIPKPCQPNKAVSLVQGFLILGKQCELYCGLCHRPHDQFCRLYIYHDSAKQSIFVQLTSGRQGHHVRQEQQNYQELIRQEFAKESFSGYKHKMRRRAAQPLQAIIRWLSSHKDSLGTSENALT